MILAVVPVLTFAGEARGQASGPSAPPTTLPDGRTPEQLRQEVLDRMRALRAWKIVDGLKLDQATAAKLFPVLSRYDDREMALLAERKEIVRALRSESEAARPDNARLTSGIDKLIANRLKQRSLENDKIRELRALLPPVQQAKLVLLLPRIEREFARRIRDVMHDKEKRRGRGREED
jgi:hypothetical protein